ncbi:hypothetical protein [Roseivirga sp. E12]|uniref:hypothetical protein n=1 Tax=Roseivirga sp. E12 TaxID=2819237 RepID=UPI001ABBFDC0|nr:hypothetical protein [Roseivirga sp. E12]MBO3697733.1 hypothetical protein [Roseivirga sp. E12]
MKQLIAVLLFLFSSSAIAQNSKAIIKEKATEVATATVNSDWDTVIEYTYPKIVQMVGGKEQMTSVLINMMEQQQIEFISADIGEPSDIYTTGDDNLFSLVPQTIVMKMPNGKIKTESYLLAISEDKGLKWYFIDTAQITMQNVQVMLPNYNMDLVIPPKKQPILLDN